jgi:hypothetical protein
VKNKRTMRHANKMLLPYVCLFVVILYLRL